MNQKLKVFIGSSGESRRTAEQIARIVSECDHDPVPWYDAFPPGVVIFSRLVDLSKEVDAAVFVFSEDDRVFKGGTENLQPRDNVVLEYGLFARALGPEKSIICVLGNPTLPIDILGLTWIRVTDQHTARPKLREWLEGLKSATVTEQEAGGEISVEYFRESAGGKFTDRVSDALTKAKKVALMGSGVAILANPVLVDSLMRRAEGGECEVEIYLANPHSPSVETRLIEEEQGKIRPSDGKLGLLSRLRTLVDRWRTGGCPASVTIKVSTHYPTFALIIVDDDYYVYPYSYRTLGNFSPVFVFSRKVRAHEAVIQFFDEHYQRIKEDAVNALQVIDRQIFRREALRGFAVYFVPDKESDLYNFGSAVLGYDVHGRQKIESQWEAPVGRARTFGFHLTICDALYLWNEAEARKAAAEVAYVVRDFEPFMLVNLAIERDCPNPGNIAVAARDPSRKLESLHHEFVQRLYRRAAASDYTMGLASNRSGASFVTNRYHAPYILNWFKPHFTLLAGPDRSDRAAEYDRVKELFESRVTSRTVRVDRVHIMAWSPTNGRWFIEKEVMLGMREHH